MSHAIKQNVMLYHHCTQATDAQGIHIYEMCRAFSKLNWVVEKVGLVREDGALEQKDTKSKLGWVHKLPTWLVEILRLGYNLREIWRLYRTIYHTKPCFIYERYSLYLLAGVFVAKWTNIPLVVEINSPLVYELKQDGKIFWQRFAQFCENYVLRHATKVIAVTHVLKNMLVQAGAIEEKIVVIPNGINLEEIDIATSNRTASSIDTIQHATIGFVGWFRAWHCLPELIATLDSHGIFQRGVTLWLVGDGPARPDIEKEIQKRNLTQSVFITGALSRQEVFNILKKIDIALQPAVNIYACPMKLIEYMAVGKAIIAPDLPNIQEILQDGYNGLLFPNGDWQDLAQKIDMLLDSSTLRNELGQNARKTILSRPYTWIKNAEETLALLGISKESLHV